MHYRKVWETFHGIKIPVGWHIHHMVPKCKGGTDCISNLIACPVKAHNKFHLLNGDVRTSMGFLKIGDYYGKNNAMYGRNPLDFMTDEARQERAMKISKGNQKPFNKIQYRWRNQDTDEIFNGTQWDLYKTFDLSSGHINSVLSGKRNHHKNWEIEDYARF